MQQVLPFQALRAKTDRVTKPLCVSQMKSAASPGRVSRRAQFGRERPPVFGRWSAQNPLGSASGRSRPPCARVDVHRDIDIFIVIDVRDDKHANAEREQVNDEADDAFDDSLLVAVDAYCLGVTRFPRRISSVTRWTMRSPAWR